MGPSSPSQPQSLILPNQSIVAHPLLVGTSLSPPAGLPAMVQSRPRKSDGEACTMAPTGSASIILPPASHPQASCLHGLPPLPKPGSPLPAPVPAPRACTSPAPCSHTCPSTPAACTAQPAPPSKPPKSTPPTRTIHTTTPSLITVSSKHHSLLLLLLPLLHPLQGPHKRWLRATGPWLAEVRRTALQRRAQTAR